MALFKLLEKKKNIFLKNYKLSNLLHNNIFVFLLILNLIFHYGTFIYSKEIYWDDWTLFNHSFNNIYDNFIQTGAIFGWPAFIHNLLIYFGRESYGILTFILYTLNSCLIYSIARNHSFINIDSAFLIAALYILLPLGISRVTMIVFPYTLCSFLFLIGWLLLLRNKFYLALLFFILSFNINSFLVIFYLIILDYFYINKKWFKLFNIYLIAPILFYIAKYVYFKPYGNYAGYNENFSIMNLYPSFLKMISHIEQISINIYLFIIILILISLILSFCVDKFLIRDDFNNKLFFIITLVALFLSLFPYLILGHIPSINTWTSRHFLVFHIVLPFFIWASFNLLSPKLLKHVFLCIIISYSSIINFKLYNSLECEKSRKTTITNYFNEYKFSNKLIIVRDHTTSRLWKNQYPYYELSGMARKALGHSSNLVLNEYEYLWVNNNNYSRFISVLFNSGDFNTNNFSKELLTLSGDYCKPQLKISNFFTTTHN